jgi:hypothetical protein
MTKLYLLLIPLILTLVFQNAVAEQDWNNYWIKGKYYLPNSKLAFQVFKIPYRITGGEVEKIELPYTGSDLVTKIKTYQDGIFEIKIPLNLPMTNAGREILPFITFIDGKETKHQEEKEKCLIAVSIPFQNGSRLIEIIDTVDLGSDPIRSIKVSPECIIKPSPKDQIENGILPQDVVCSDNLVLIKKISKDTVACVRPITVEKLVQRGWGVK